MKILVPGCGREYLHGDSLDHTQPLVFAVDGVLRPAECAEMIARIERLKPSAAPISTPRGFVMRPDIRNNTRVMFDDVGLAAELFARIGGAVPARLCDRRPVGVNERFRCYRYEDGQRFAPHYDGAFAAQRSRAQRADADGLSQRRLRAAATTAFHDFDVAATPRTGCALMFQHQLLHEGCVRAIRRSSTCCAPT